jgi:hypothetical protein
VEEAQEIQHEQKRIYDHPYDIGLYEYLPCTASEHPSSWSTKAIKNPLLMVARPEICLAYRFE